MVSETSSSIRDPIRHQVNLKAIQGFQTAQESIFLKGKGIKAVIY